MGDKNLVTKLLLYTTCTDEKIKLWLFLPGRHSTVADSAQAAVSKLRGTMCLVFVIMVLYNSQIVDLLWYKIVSAKLYFNFINFW